jgi:FkbM family methyltransferase
MTSSILQQPGSSGSALRQTMSVATLKSLVRRLLPASARNRLDARYHRRHGEIELLLVRHLCRRDRVAIDVGANAGSYTLFMQRHARAVYAFEPIGDLAHVLARKFRRRVTVSTIALSDRSGSATLSIPVQAGERVTGLSSLSDDVRRQHADCDGAVVRTARLDDIGIPPPGFIKIDVEGHEEAVLHGAQRTIEASRPNVLLEIEERHAPGAIARIRKFFAGLDYIGLYAHRTRLAPIEIFDPSVLQRPEAISDLGPATDRKLFSDYVNNFIFVPAERADVTRQQLEAELARQSRLLRTRQTPRTG